MKAETRKRTWLEKTLRVSATRFLVHPIRELRVVRKLIDGRLPSYTEREQQDCSANVKQLVILHAGLPLSVFPSLRLPRFTSTSSASPHHSIVFIRARGANSGGDCDGRHATGIL
jgi:hypothetical protein